jgi:hypothetical protein
MIVYARFSVSLHGMSLRTEAELEQLRQRMDELVRQHVHPSGGSNIFDSDVEVEIEEHAGQPTLEELVLRHGEENRAIIKAAMEYLDANEAEWKLDEPMDRDAYIRDMLSRKVDRLTPPSS